MEGEWMVLLQINLLFVVDTNLRDNEFLYFEELQGFEFKGRDRTDAIRN